MKKKIIDTKLIKNTEIKKEGTLYITFFCYFCNIIKTHHPLSMKKLTSLLSFAILSICATATPISPQRALSIAKAYQVEGQTVSLSPNSPTRRAGKTTAPYYVFSRGAGQGYVIVAGDDCIPTLIGYTESGDFDEQKEAPQLMDLLAHYTHIVETLQEKGLNTPYQDSSAKAPDGKYHAEGRVNIPPILTSHWHQDTPYNDKVPKLANGKRAAAGCVAIASAQVFYFWRKDMPSKLAATTPTYDYGDAPATSEYQIKAGTPLKWELMLDSYNQQPAEYRDAVATVVAATGMQSWMTYGESSGAYIWDVPFNLYNLNAERADKDNNHTDSSWASLLYKDLEKGLPLVYSGYNEEWEGHALVIDGYKASGDLFHFNFGWGGQSDGYYTVNESGDNNIIFGKSPTVMYNIHPRKYNLKADIQLPARVYAKATNDIVVGVSNHSSVPLSGIYLFVNTTGNKPSKLSQASSSDTETVIRPGMTEEITLPAKTTTTDTWHLFITDEDLNVLAQETVQAIDNQAELWVENLRVNGTTEQENHGGKDYTLVYNKTRTSVTATIRNKGISPYESDLSLNLYATEDEGNTWQMVNYKIEPLVIGAGEKLEVTFNISKTTSTPLAEDKLYRVALVSPIPRSSDPLLCDMPTDTTAYFILKANDLTVDHFTDGILTLKGHWDPILFNSTTIAKKSSYKTATAYDLTQVSGVGELSPISINPNALYYVADESMTQGTNVVKGGRCDQLTLIPGYPFAAKAAFQATRAQLAVDNASTRWSLITTPFQAEVPYGVFARRIDSHTASGISGRTTDVTTLEPGKTYLLTTSCTGNHLLQGEDTEVVTAPAENTDPALHGTFLNIPVPEGAMTINQQENQSFDFQKEGTIEAFRGYFMADDVTNFFLVSSNTTMDPVYITLGQNIQKARHTLVRYRDIVTDEAYDNYLSAILEAEKEFTLRTSKTTSKIKNMAENLLTLGNEYILQIKDVGNMEVDFTCNVKNPSFEMKSTTGWTLSTPLNTQVTASSAARVYANSSYIYFTSEADGDYLLNNSYYYIREDGSRDTLGVGISQEVYDLVPGYYRLSAQLASDEGNTITLFAGDTTSEVTAHPFGRHYFTEAVLDSIAVRADEGTTTGRLTIGVKAGKWYKADNFRLTYSASFHPDDDQNGIATPETAPHRTVRGVYNLEGQRIERITQPGIYIIDGKKRVVRP